MKNFLKRKARIYILPTKMGGYLNGLIFLMFLLSIGYSNNLLLIFTLFLLGLNLVWLLQTHFHLHRLKLHSVQLQDGHAQEPQLVRVFWKKSPKAPLAWDLSLENDRSHTIFSSSHSEEISEGHLTMKSRGVHHWQHLKVKTTFPFGLYKVWIYLPISVATHAYPVKFKDSIPFELKKSIFEGEASALKPGPHDIWNLSKYQGEEARKISWKHYARSGELVVKEGEELIDSSVHFEFYDNEEKEYLLSKIATQMVDYNRNNISFSLSTKNKSIPLGLSDSHLHECLRELALC